MSPFGPLLLLALVPADTAGVELPAQQRGGVTARLRVVVPDEPAAPGRAQVFWSLGVEGPPGLEVDGPRLEDALDGWRRVAEASSWAAGDRVEISWRLVQAKPGVVPLPGVTLRVRAGPSAAWVEMSWHDLLQEPRDGPAPIELPPLPGSPWPRRALALVGALAVLGGAALAVRRWRRWRAGRTPPLTPRQLALGALAPPALPGEDRPRERFAHIAFVLRDFAEREIGVPAGRLTTDELARSLQQAGVAEADVAALREVLGHCDVVKFSGSAAANVSCLDRARHWVGALRRQDGPDTGAGKEHPPGEDG